MKTSSRLSFKSAPVALAAVLCVGLFAGCGKNKGKVHFGNLSDGAEVESPFTVEMRAENLTVEPASEGVKDGHGHFHILVDTPVPMSLDPIPNDAQHIHYGLGQTEAVLDLPEGEHTLILQFAKGDHRPYDPQITQEIRVRVTKRNAPGGEGMDGMNGSDSGHGHDGAMGGGDGGGSTVNGSGATDTAALRKGDPRNIQAAPGSGSGTGAGSSGASGSSGGAAM